MGVEGVNKTTTGSALEDFGLLVQPRSQRTRDSQSRSGTDMWYGEEHKPTDEDGHHSDGFGDMGEWRWVRSYKTTTYPSHVLHFALPNHTPHTFLTAKTPSSPE